MKKNNKPIKFEYHLDFSDRIVFVDENWSIFALDNDAPFLTKEKVINTNIYDYISDAETRHIYEVLLDNIRGKGKEKKFPFRCDSPRLRRYMEMRIFPSTKGNVIIKTKILKEEQREELPLLEKDIVRSEEYIRMCSWCKKIFIKNDEWVEVEDAIRALSLFSHDMPPQITHTICTPCKGKYLRNLEA